MPQMASMEAIEGKGESSGKPLPPISPLDKIIVAFAGPLFSFLLAFFFAVVVWMVGRPVSADDNSTPVGWVDPNGPAWKAGLRPGDRIKEVDGYPVGHFGAPDRDSITWRIVTSQEPKIAIRYVRDGEEHSTYAAPETLPTKWYERKSLRKFMISPAHPAIIYEVSSNSPAAVAGLEQGTRCVA